MEDSENWPAEKVPCHYQLTGPIEAGDAQKLKDLILLQGRTTLCLNSRGGSFEEAMTIATQLMANAIGTKLEPGSECLSACAIVFMAGSIEYFEVGLYSWRHMHATSKFGLS